MELDSTDSYLKDNLENIMNGEWIRILRKKN